MLGLFRKEAPKVSVVQPGAANPERRATLLVVQSDNYDWPAIFKGKKLGDGREITVVQCGWDEMLVSAVKNDKAQVEVRVGAAKRVKTIRPDFCLIRNEVFTPFHDHRNQLYGLMFANVPSINSLSSVYMFCERPIIQAELNRLNRELGDDVFPIVRQSYFSNYRSIMYGDAFPAVVKVGAAHAGYGKMRVPHYHDMEDFRSVMAMTEGKYCTIEPFINGAFDLRIQKIGSHYRAFKRVSVSGTWKTNTGSAHIEEVECTAQYKLWAERAAEMFGGLDILSVDAIHDADSGKELIMEVNGTSSGLVPDTEAEDNTHIMELVLQRMNAVCLEPPGSAQGE